MALHEVEIKDLPALFGVKQCKPLLPSSITIKDGYLTSNKEYHALAMLCALQNPETIFEIGTFEGFTAQILAMNASRSTVYTLDLPPGKGSTTFAVGDLNQRYIRNRGMLMFKGTPQEKQITRLFGDSATFDFSPYKGKIDFVFIDGAHTYQYTKNDTEKAFDIASKKGLIVWHDYNPSYWKETVRFIDELAKKKNLYRIQDTYLVFLKR